MLSVRGHCEDPTCANSSSFGDVVRLFRCSIHCNRNLCLYHLNSHNIYYEEEKKKQNDIAIDELQKCLNLYHKIFEQQSLVYHKLISQASVILLYNTYSPVPIDQIRSLSEIIQQANALLQKEKSKKIFE